MAKDTSADLIQGQISSWDCSFSTSIRIGVSSRHGWYEVKDALMRMGFVDTVGRSSKVWPVPDFNYPDDIAMILDVVGWEMTGYIYGVGLSCDFIARSRQQMARSGIDAKLSAMKWCPLCGGVGSVGFSSFYCTEVDCRNYKA